MELTPVFSAIFYRIWQYSERNRPVGFRMSPLPGPKASSIRVAEYLTELPPREVLEQKLEGSGGDCTGAARGTGKYGEDP